MNTQDRELLDLAAKAAGYKFKWFKVKQFKITDPPYGRCRYFTGYKDVFGKHHTKPWNPLEDDGDALRLAVDLEIDILIRASASEVWAQAPLCRMAIEPFGGDKLAATRRAIVRAAAEIGRRMK